MANDSVARMGGGRRAAVRLALALLLASFSACAVENGPSSLQCGAGRCGLLADGAYTNVVIGQLTHVGTATDTIEVFHWAKAHGLWKRLPESIEPYLRDVQLVTLDVPSGMASQPVTLFMLQTEYHSASYHEGDLVRYAPHDAAHDGAAKGSVADLALFHGLTGCVATLCRKGDRICFKRYRQGVFTTAHGEQISPATGNLVRGGARIDPVSLLPVPSN